MLVPHGLRTDLDFIADTPEVINSFMDIYGIIGHYLDSYRNPGRIDPETGKWSGMLGFVRMKKEYY